jgi:hypothetical protein
VNSLFQHIVLLYLFLYRSHNTLPDTLNLDAFRIGALLELFDLQNIDHFSNNFLKVPDLGESFFELLPELLIFTHNLGGLWGVLDHLGFEFHFLRGLLFDSVLENEFLLFEVVDLGLQSVDVHGGTLISGSRVEYLFFESVILVLELNVLLVNGPDPLFQLLDLKSHA